ncbi:hypothetical protein [Streptomyces sp. NPDC005773]|uniref:hypothetical protein n=1 Tax=Streptomyces sp. NPDC005773 TaxID=3364727 RepID=UPI0036C02E1F
MDELIDHLSGEVSNKLTKEREEKSERLEQIFARIDPLDLLCRASLTYAQVDPDSFRESENDQLPAHIEFLALRALPHIERVAISRKINPLEAASLTSEAIKLTREMFSATSEIKLFHALKESRGKEDAIQDEYILRTRIESMNVRGSGYPEHLTRVLRGCFDGLDAECRRLLGFTARDAISVVHCVHNIVEDRVHPLRTAAAQKFTPLSALLKRQRRKGTGPFPQWLATSPPNIGKKFLSMFVISEMLDDSLGVCTVTVAQIVADSGIPEGAVQAVLDSFSCNPEEYNESFHKYPVGAHPLTERPFLETPQGYILPVPAAMFEALRPRMEDLFMEVAGSKLWERYLTDRGKYLVRETVDLLREALPGATGECELPWSSSITESDLDGIVFSDDVTFRIQGKAGRLHAAARRGAPGRMKKNIKELIESAALQHQSLANALQSEGAESIGLGECSAALGSRFQLEVIVCLDDITVWATDTHQLAEFGSIPADRPIPWILSLTDLMVVTDLLNGSLLAHYVIRRQRLERLAFVSAHDELDWVGHYIQEGLYFDPYLASGTDKVRLLSYTDPIDAWYLTRNLSGVSAANKPAPGIPKELSEFLDRLAHVRPEGWITASLALVDGDESSLETWGDFLLRARGRVSTTGWSNASQVFNGRLGITIYMDQALVRMRDLGLEIRRYAQRKQAEMGLPNWVVVGDSGGKRLAVRVIESPGNGGLERVFLG